MNALMLVIKYWRYVAVAVACISLSSFITYKIQDIRYKDLQNQFNGCQTSLNSCLVANEENQATITSLQKEIALKTKSCEARISHYKNLIKKLQSVDNLTGGKHEEGTVDCPDDICVNLNRMWH